MLLIVQRQQLTIAIVLPIRKHLKLKSITIFTF